VMRKDRNMIAVEIEKWICGKNIRIKRMVDVNESERIDGNQSTYFSNFILTADGRVADIHFSDRNSVGNNPQNRLCHALGGAAPHVSADLGIQKATPQQSQLPITAYS
jgi:hypothetical protein